MSAYALAATGRPSAALAAVTSLVFYASYLIDHLAEVDRFPGVLESTRSAALGRRRARHMVQGALAFAAALVVTGLRAGWGAAAALFLFPLAVALYGTPLLGRLTRGRLRRLKDIPCFKAFYTATCWGAYPLFGHVFLGTQELAPTLWFCGFLMLRMFVNTVLCDFKDLERDQAEGVRTLPLALGLAPALAVLRWVNFASLILLCGATLAGALPAWTMALGLVVPYARALFRRVGQPGADVTFLCEVGADGEFSLWLPCAALGMTLARLCA
jgi:4-hydroxybenzoate polyprenyltransferase